MLCVNCHSRPASHNAVINGVYYKNLCAECLPRPSVSSGHARWARSLDAEDHEHEIQQPYKADGSINPRFARLYPKQAKSLFTPEQLRDAELK